MEELVVELVLWSLQTISGLDLTQSSPLTPRVEGGKPVCLINSYAAFNEKRNVRACVWA